MTRLLKRLWPEEQAESLYEYTLFLVLVSLTAVTAMNGLASRINSFYSGASMRVETSSRSASLAGGSLSLSYGRQTHTDTDPPSADDMNVNPN